MSTQYDFIDDSFKLQGETRNLVLSQCLHPFKGFSPRLTRKVQLQWLPLRELPMTQKRTNFVPQNQSFGTFQPMCVGHHCMQELYSSS